MNWEFIELLTLQVLNLPSFADRKISGPLTRIMNPLIGAIPKCPKGKLLHLRANLYKFCSTMSNCPSVAQQNMWRLSASPVTGFCSEVMVAPPRGVSAWVSPNGVGSELQGLWRTVI